MKRSYTITLASFVMICLHLFACSVSSAQPANDAIEPSVSGQDVINLLTGNASDTWTIPSNHWQVDAASIVATTGNETLSKPEWIYTKQKFSDFEFTCEIQLTGDERRNTGIYYRATPVTFRNQYEAPSGYEFDVAPGGHYWGSVGDWYVRPQLRVYADSNVIAKVVDVNGWNRHTLRAHGNRLEYWINGIKVMDFTDPDPKGAREGLIGFQIHDGSVMKIAYRNIRILPLKK